jgi:hypothetical protein
MYKVTRDTDFKLHLANNTIIKAKVEMGKLVDWLVAPESRKKDVIVCQPQK